jgi:hypothetical protein
MGKRGDIQMYIYDITRVFEIFKLTTTNKYIVG